MSDSSDTFGDLLRACRLEAGMGLRELARRLDISAGYLSDVELNHVPPPSEEVIVSIAGMLSVDRSRLLNAARKVDPELADYVVNRPRAADFLRMAKDRDFSDEDWKRLSQLVEISRIGKDEDNRQ